MKEVLLEGEIIGEIWEPGCECTKEFRKTLLIAPHHRLRSAFKGLINDGDFQSASILNCWITITWKGEHNRTISKSVQLKGVADSDLWRKENDCTTNV